MTVEFGLKCFFNRVREMSLGVILLGSRLTIPHDKPFFHLLCIGNGACFFRKMSVSCQSVHSYLDEISSES